MIVISKNLQQLAAQYQICDAHLVDEYSIRLQLGPIYHEVIAGGEVVTYGQSPDPSKIFSDRKEATDCVVLAPGACILSATRHKYKIPSDYLGLVQTKGTLARIFVSTTCNDGQIEPGFNGYITLELINHSPWTVRIPIGSEVAQMYMLKCSTNDHGGYNGRYSESAKTGPTLPVFQK